MQSFFLVNVRASLMSRSTRCSFLEMLKSRRTRCPPHEMFASLMSQSPTSIHTSRYSRPERQEDGQPRTNINDSAVQDCVPERRAQFSAPFACEQERRARFAKPQRHSRRTKVHETQVAKAGQIGCIGNYNGHEKYKQIAFNIITGGKNTYDARYTV